MSDALLDLGSLMALNSKTKSAKNYSTSKAAITKLCTAFGARWRIQSRRLMFLPFLCSSQLVPIVP